MKIKVPTIQKGSIKRESLPLVTEPHNIRYSHAEKNCLCFQVLHFPVFMNRYKKRSPRVNLKKS